MDLTEQRHLQTAQPVLVWSPHPLDPARDREIVHAVFYPGETIAQYLDRSGIAQRLGRRPVVCAINGRRVPRELWPHCRPHPGTLINLYAVVRGGGGKKNPIATVLQIALMVYAPGIGNSLAGAMGIGSSTLFGVAAGRIIGGAIAIVGGMVINAIFPPPKPNLSQAEGRAAGATESPTYSLAGGSNRMRPFEPLAKYAGRHRAFPDLSGRPFNEFEGDDQYLYMVFDFGYNDLILSDYKIGSTPIGNYQGVTLQESGADGKITLFPGNIDTQSGAAIEGTGAGVPGPWIQRTSSPNATGLGIDIIGTLFAIDGASGAIVANAIDLDIEFRAVGAGAWLPFVDAGATVQILNGARKPVRKTFWREVAEGQYEVRLRGASTTVGESYTAELAWSQLRTYQPDTADYTGRRRVGLKIKASGQLNGAVEQFSAAVSARCLAWNGAAWVTAETSNPAWWVLDVARGKRVGDRRVWGGLIPDARIDLENIKAFGAWCAAKNLSFDGVFDQQMPVFDMLNAIALCGRGTVSRGGGRLEAVWDAPDQPVVAVFSMSNIKRDSFEIAYQTGDLADEIVLSFINPDLDWQRDTVRQLVAGVTQPVRSRSVEAFGCIRKSMAGQWVNLLAAQQALRTKTYRWQTDWEGQPASRGNVVKLAHDLASPDYSGRLAAGSTDSVLKLSRKVPLADAGAFVTIVKPDQSFATYDVAGGAGESDTLNLTAPLGFDPGADAGHPVHDYKWLYGHTSTPGKKVKISGWSPKGPDTVEITAIDETPEFYAAEDNAYQYTAPRPVFGNVEISNLQLTEDGVRAGTGYLVKCTASWDTGAGYALAEVRVSVDGGPLELRGETRGRGFSFTVPDFSEVAVELTAWSSLARLGRFVKLTAAKTMNFAAVALPDAVQVFSIDGEVLRWLTVNAVDVVGYRIRFHYGDRRTWEDAAPLHAGLLTATPWRPTVMPSGALAFLIKPVDAAGLESAAAAAIVTDLGDPPIANVIEEFDLRAAGFPGTIAGGAIAAGNLVADETATFYKPDDGAPFYESSDGAPFYAATEYAEMTYTTGDIAPAAPLSGSAFTIVSAIAGAPVHIEYRQTGPNAFYAEDDGDAFYSPDDSAPFYAPAPGWSVWPGAIVVSHQPYNFRFITGQGAVQGAISALVLTIDAPDIEETLNDIAIAAGGTRLALTEPFSVVKNLQLTLEADGGTAVGVRILDKDAVLGPLVRCVNDAGAYVAGTVDARVKGY